MKAGTEMLLQMHTGMDRHMRICQIYLVAHTGGVSSLADMMALAARNTRPTLQVSKRARTSLPQLVRQPS